MRQQTETLLRLFTELVNIVGELDNVQKTQSNLNQLPTNPVVMQQHVDMITGEIVDLLKRPTDKLALSSYMRKLVEAAGKTGPAINTIEKPEIYGVIKKLSLNGGLGSDEDSLPRGQQHNKICMLVNNRFAIEDVIIRTELVRTFFNREWAVSRMDASNLTQGNITRIKQIN